MKKLYRSVVCLPGAWALTSVSVICKVYRNQHLYPNKIESVILDFRGVSEINFYFKPLARIFFELIFVCAVFIVSALTNWHAEIYFLFLKFQNPLAVELFPN